MTPMARQAAALTEGASPCTAARTYQDYVVIIYKLMRNNFLSHSPK